MEDIVITSAVRTAIGKFGGTYKGMPATKLGAEVVRESVKRAGVEPTTIDEVIMGMVVTAGQGQNPARQALLGAGLPETIGALTVNKVCGSSLKAVVLAAQSIKAGDQSVVVAGGMENMSIAPYVLDQGRFGYRLGDGKIKDTMVFDGLWDIYNDFHMGNTGEIVSEKHGISREEMDQWSLDSHLRAAAAQESGAFREEIMPVEVKVSRKETVTMTADEGVRGSSTIEGLQKLRPVFKKDGVVTAGNASQISDGACALTIMSRSKAEELGAKPLAKIVSYNTAGMKPEDVMSAPIPGIRRLLDDTKTTIGDYDLIEHNEAFAAATCAVKKEFNIPGEKLNVNGGAVAIGHPIGASGARVLTTLLYALKNRGGKLGMASICLGGGNAVTMSIEVE